ncbi:MAG: pyocin activator PrtN family protein [Ramlibacter sp.]|nr:pyocin activator PrtN family protein [Ramlibacter sp.]
MKTELALLLTHESPVLSIDEVATLLGITVRSLENQIYAHRCPIPMFKMGSKFCAHVADVAAYIDAQRAQAIREDHAANSTLGRAVA